MGWVAWRKGAGLHYKRLEAFSEMKSANYWGIRSVGSRNFFKNAPSIESWANKLIWGDNKLILASLKAGALRRQIEDAGGLKLIYIDPPFDVGADFSMDIEIGGETFHKEPNLLEQIAYRDTWGRGADSFIAMIYERLILMRDLMHSDGSIYVHCDPRVNAFIRLILSEVFGPDYFRSEIIWKRTSAHADVSIGFGDVTDTIFFYTKSETSLWNQVRVPLTETNVEEKYTYKEADGRRYATRDLRSPHPRPNLTYDYKGYKPHANGWSITQERMEQYDREGRLYFPSNPDGRIRLKNYLVVGVKRGMSALAWGLVMMSQRECFACR